MAEYVTKKQVIDWYRPYGQTDEPIPFETLVSDLRDMKTADVVPVRHGLWEKVAWWQHQNRYECNECSVCGCRVKPKFTYNYCPNCGAKMDLDG